MSWFKLDDSLREHPKWMGLSLYARAIWVDAGMWCAKNNNDGVIPPRAIDLICLSAKVPAKELDAAIKNLLAERMWERRTKAAGAGWKIHDWEKYQPLKEQVQRKADKQGKHSWLHKTRAGKSVKARIERRDGIWCRYCGVEFNMSDGDRRGPTRRTHDFIDPDFTPDMSQNPTATSLDAAAAAIVLACGYCNAVKGDRTPDEAGMILRAAPGATRNHSRSVRERVAVGPRPVRGVGTGRNGSGQIGSEQVASGRDGSRHGKPAHDTHGET